jgi:phage N-6-adenine-methyltransferase
MEIDPEFKSLIRILDAEESRVLTESILTEGCREPIITWQGLIIDGHNRYKICNENNIPFKTTEIEFSSREDAKIWIIKNQLGRRNLNIAERASLALKLEPLIAAKAKERQIATLKRGDVMPDTQKSAERGETREELAKVAGVSHDTIDKMKVIEESGNEELKKAVLAGDVKINAAATTIKTMEKVQLFTSETDEWYTPKEIIDSVIQMFGEIDLDPCSNNNEIPNVPAKNHFTKEDDGLSKEWFGKVYMNPPYGSMVKKFIEKLKSEIEMGRVQEAIVLVAARTDTEWWNILTEMAWSCCFIRGRLRFSESENSATFPSAILYTGDRWQEFHDIFENHGSIWMKWGAMGS